MLTSLTGKPRQARFTVFDLEWWPNTYELRLIGVYDEERGYRYYLTVRDFFDKELHHGSTRRRFYAHFGGSSDFIFLLDYLLRKAPDLRANAIFAGSSAVIMKVQKPSPKGRGDSWTFVDSGFLIRRPLRDIGKWLGLEKGDKDVIYSENFGEIRTYNERDCVILYNAISRLQNQLNEHGGELRPTLASSALDMFRRRFLHRVISTDDANNEIARKAYIASRVEVFQRNCPKGEYYDFNSSFPTSMARPQPGNFIGIGRRIPERRDSTYLASMVVSVPQTEIPPLAYRTHDSRILFPCGKWEGTFDCADVELLLRSGGSILRVNTVYHFEPFSDLAEYVHELYEQKERATGYEREVWKLLLNGLYGKFGERSDKRRIVIRPEDTSKGEEIAPDIWAIEEQKELAHAHVPIAAHVTALSRGLLYDALVKCRQVFYCDTDSVVCGANDVLPTGPGLGELKHEYTVRNGIFLAPKLYSFEKPNGERLVKAKGFSRLDYESFCGLLEGREFVIKRMQRIRESLNADETITPRDVTVAKKIYLENTKRRFLADGSSVPWTVEEVERLAG